MTLNDLLLEVIKNQLSFFFDRMDGRHMFVCVFVSLSFSHMCCRSSCLCKWTVMLSISGRTGLCYCVAVDAFLLGEPGFVLHDRACVSACMCMYCMFCALYKIESHLCRCFSGKNSLPNENYRVGFERLCRHADRLYVKLSDDYLPINSTLIIWNVPEGNGSRWPVAVEGRKQATFSLLCKQQSK